jgi:hypothetical protein
VCGIEEPACCGSEEPDWLLVALAMEWVEARLRNEAGLHMILDTSGTSVGRPGVLANTVARSGNSVG